jgi:hypothetical protein
MLYGYELVTFASSPTDLCHPHGYFGGCLLGLRRASELIAGAASPASVIVRRGVSILRSRAGFGLYTGKSRWAITVL